MMKLCKTLVMAAALAAFGLGGSARAAKDRSAATTAGFVRMLWIGTGLALAALGTISYLVARGIMRQLFAASSAAALIAGV